jgi:hypothetical protein
MKAKKFIILISLLASACVVSVGPTIEAPAIPAPTKSTDVFPVLVQVKNFRDVRLVSEEEKGPISPEGDISELVKDAFINYLEKRGASVEFSAPVTIEGEIRSWEAQARGTSTGMLNSSASLYIEVKDSSGNKLYSGVFQGSRSSQFPLVSKADIKDSLGFAMAQAIDQSLNDASFRKALNSK